VNITLIDSEPTSAGRHRLQRLANQVKGVVIEAPLLRHGAMLDLLFTSLRDNRLLLLDSDAEITSDILDRMRRDLEADDVYGSGWVHGPTWLHGVFGDEHAADSYTGWYLQRPWVPCAMLKREPVADAIASGTGFREGLIPNDIPRLRSLNRLMLARLFVPGLRRLRLTTLASLRREFDGQRPNFCYADTGAILHRALLGRGLRFSGPDAVQTGTDGVRHQHGATRAALAGRAYAD
jgi:hypothetical protein